MRKKLKEEAGLTLVEMLAATVILILLALMLNTGLQMALHSYETMIAKSEVELLLSTAVDALADDLRYARDVDGQDGSGFQYIYDPDSGTRTNQTMDKGGFNFTSGSFGNVTELKVAENGDNKGQIMAVADGDKRVLSTGVYGNEGISYKAYEVTKMTVTYHKPESGASTFTIYLKVETTDSRKISAETTVTVRCLNPPAETTTPAGGVTP